MDLKIYRCQKSLRLWTEVAGFECADWNEEQYEAFQMFMDLDENIERSDT